MSQSTTVSPGEEIVGPPAPTYTEQLDAILMDVQHMRIGVPEARNLFLKMMDHAVVSTLQDYMQEQKKNTDRPRIISIH